MRISDWSSDVGSSDLIAYGDSIELTDTLKDGIVENLLLVLEKGGRLAARRGTRANEIITLDNAAYSPCAVEDSEGRPKEPTWQHQAVRGVYIPYIKSGICNGELVESFGVPPRPPPGRAPPVAGARRT